MDAPVLQMRGIEKRFGGVRALKGVDFEISAGEVVALAGENGAGKSTLMKILGGVHQPDAGEIIVDGQPVKITGVSDSTKLGVSFIHQELNVLENLDVAANVYLGREPVKGGFLKLVDSQKMHQDAAVYLKRLGLEIPTNTQLWRLSIAQQQMVEIAKALSLDARILIMDEPTSSLTLTETDRLLALVHELKAQNVAIIYISHRLNEIEQIADRVVVLRDGANAGQLGRGEITHDRMVKLMVGRDIESFYQHPEGERARGYVQIQGLRTLRYPRHEVSFDVGRGEIMGMAGLVGAGRTEVAQSIFGIDGPVQGRITIGGQELRIRSPQDAIRHGIYLVPEDRRLAGLITDIAIRENVTLPSLERYSQAWLIARDKETKAADSICKKLNVKTPSVEQKVINLSGGNQQKVVLAKWLALEPKFLIFDEPTRGVDVGAKAEIYRVIDTLADAGLGVVVVSSELSELAGLCTRVLVMREGRVVAEVPGAEATELELLRH
ncbi:MAG TPA: sugar ABC transporter ATP-binding protein, partial [Pyrinomonadaceae bacterium]|nr:sugar ABC transporter ATP-binding protein [Pyrinomonadaceae bacterium]